MAKHNALLLRSLLFVSVLALTAPVHAHAASAAPASPKGDWGVGMIKDDKGKFNYCLMRAPYDNGLSLALALSPKGELNIGVQVPKAAYGKEDKFPMVVAVDGKLQRQRVAVPVNEELLLTPMGPDKELIAAIRKGNVLSMKGPEDTAFFKLKGTSKAFSNLQQCVDVGTGKVKAPTQAAANAPKGGKKGGFPPGLLQLLKDSGLSDVEPLDVPDPTKSPVDLAWRTNGVMGGLRERPVPKEETIEKMSDLIEGSFKKQCSGTYNVTNGEIEKLPGMLLRKADVSCQMDKHMVNVSLLLYRTDEGLFSMFMHEGPDEKKDAAMKARDAIAESIRKLAKEHGDKQGAK